MRAVHIFLVKSQALSFAAQVGEEDVWGRRGVNRDIHFQACCLFYVVEIVFVTVVRAILGERGRFGAIRSTLTCVAVLNAFVEEVVSLADVFIFYEITHACPLCLIVNIHQASILEVFTREHKWRFPAFFFIIGFFGGCTFFRWLTSTIAVAAALLFSLRPRSENS
uniref:Uncharacterized protein n=1 Tax=Amblyomma triste TaxID=251400 RepID=A0A023G1C6_AMBTT